MKSMYMFCIDTYVIVLHATIQFRQLVRQYHTKVLILLAQSLCEVGLYFHMSASIVRGMVCEAILHVRLIVIFHQSLFKELSVLLSHNYTLLTSPPPPQYTQST